MKAYGHFPLALRYLQHHWSALNSKGHGIHSPFVFDFVRSVLNNDRNYQPPTDVEDLRELLLRNPSPIHVEELGAGSRTASTHLTVAKMARTALKPRAYAELLYRLARHYQPASILELGTSLGVTTAYLAKACPDSVVTTMEGNAETAAYARMTFDALDLHNVELIEGDFDKKLPEYLSTTTVLPDLIYVDGNHRYEPTLSYFHQLLRGATANTIIVFDDIHWSPEMERAWEEIRLHPAVRYSVDIFFLGFVFFRNDFKVKQDFSIRF